MISPLLYKMETPSPCRKFLQSVVGESWKMICYAILSLWLCYTAVVDVQGVCQAPADIANGAVTTSGTAEGATATHTCTAGYTLNGGDTQTCEAGGTWSGTEPTCVQDPTVVCAAPSNIANGAVTTSGTAEGATATHTCTAGYTLNGVDKQTCEAAETWSGTEPTCVQDLTVVCAAPSNIANGAVTTSGTAEGATATHTCTAGYTVNGVDTQTCEAGGTWSGTEPTCVQDATVVCAAPGNIVNGAVTTSGTAVGATATHTCTAGYTLNGGDTQTCEAGGTWSGTEPTCVQVTTDVCVAPGGITNGAVTTPGTAVGATAAYTCNTGYTLNGGAKRTCQADGIWSGTAPNCVKASFGPCTGDSSTDCPVDDNAECVDSKCVCSDGYFKENDMCVTDPNNSASTTGMTAALIVVLFTITLLQKVL